MGRERESLPPRIGNARKRGPLTPAVCIQSYGCHLLTPPFLHRPPRLTTPPPRNFHHFFTHSHTLFIPFFLYFTLSYSAARNYKCRPIVSESDCIRFFRSSCFQEDRHSLCDDVGKRDLHSAVYFAEILGRRWREG